MSKRSGATIRPASLRDIPAIVGVVNAAYAIETFFGGTRTDAEDITELMQKGNFFVACSAAGRVHACIYTEIRGKRGYFGVLAVEPARQGQGLGRALIETAEGHCRRFGCKFVDISVLSLRPELLPLYRKLGYQETGTEEFHPPQSRQVETACHLIIMSKALPQAGPGTTTSQIGSSSAR